MENKIKDFLEESIKYLKEKKATCCKYDLDNNLAIFVGWSSGFGKKLDKNIIQDEEQLDYAIEAGIKEKETIWYDYDILSFPITKDGDIIDSGVVISQKDDMNDISKYFVEEYKKIKKEDL